MNLQHSKPPQRMGLININKKTHETFTSSSTITFDFFALVEEFFHFASLVFDL
jgi:hypothetical protein